MYSFVSSHSLSILAVFIGAVVDMHIILSVQTPNVLVVAVGIKAAIVSHFRAFDEQLVQELVQNHCNYCSSNTDFLVTDVLSNHLVWWVDPIGAIITECFIILNWSILTIHDCMMNTTTIVDVT